MIGKTQGALTGGSYPNRPAKCIHRLASRKVTQIFGLKFIIGIAGAIPIIKEIPYFSIWSEYQKQV